jgi:hypothetical protein
MADTSTQSLEAEYTPVPKRMNVINYKPIQGLPISHTHNLKFLVNRNTSTAKAVSDAAQSDIVAT